jgi:hypothetical protein
MPRSPTSPSNHRACSTSATLGPLIDKDPEWRSSYSTRVGEKTTKTDAVKHVPVHPTLAAMLAEWKLGG